MSHSTANQSNGSEHAKTLIEQTKQHCKKQVKTLVWLIDYKEQGKYN